MKNVKLSDKRGIASIEAVAMMVVFVILMAYGVGAFGVVHTGILNNIAARTYAWETFNNRANVTVFRDNREPGELEKVEHFAGYGFRIHSIASEYSQDKEWTVTERTMAMGRTQNEWPGRNMTVHQNLKQLTKREIVEVNPVWIKTIYGICMKASCGGIP